MFVAMFASMWISNVAAPVLCFSIIQVRDLSRFQIISHVTNEPSLSFVTFQPIPT
jgi:hypothetical protein